MEGATKRQVNAEEMLAELKRALESSTRAPNAPPPSASTAPKSTSMGRKPRRSPWGIDLPANANADKSIGPGIALKNSTRPGSRRRKLIAGGLALGGAAVFFAGAALMNQVLNRPAREFSATEGLVKPQNEQALGASSSPRSPMEDRSQAEPLQAGALATRPDAGAASATGGSLPAQVKADFDASHLASFGLESPAPASAPTPLNQAPALAPSIRIGPDGAPIATAPPTPASTDSAHPADTPKPAAAPAASQAIRRDGPPIATAPSAPASTASAPPPAETPKPAAPSAAPQTVRTDRAQIATAPPTPASTGSAPPAETPKPAAPSAAPQTVRTDRAQIATAPPAPASTGSAPPAETPKPAAPSAAPQTVRTDAAPIATAPSTPASADSAPPAETPKPKATPTAHASNEPKQPSAPKIDSKKKPVEKASLRKPPGSPTPPVKPIAPAERQSTEPAPPKEAERSAQSAQDTANPAQAAPVAAPSVPQRFADGMTHALGYLVHLPGALVPHLGAPNPDAH